MGFMRPEVQVFSPRPTKKCVPYGAHFFIKMRDLFGNIFFVTTAQKIALLSVRIKLHASNIISQNLLLVGRFAPNSAY